MSERLEEMAAYLDRVHGEVPVCPNCFRPTYPYDACCESCMAPVGAYAAINPLEQIWSYAWVVWKGMWTFAVPSWITRFLLFALLAQGAMQAFVGVWIAAEPPPNFAGQVTQQERLLSWFISAVHLLHAWVLVVAARRVARNRRQYLDGSHAAHLASFEGHEWTESDYADVAAAAQ